MEQVKRKKTDTKKIIRFLSILIVVLLVIGGVLWIQLNYTMEYTGYQLLTEQAVPTNIAGYLQGKNELLLCSNDGAKAIDSKGEVCWEISYQLDNPELAYCKDMASVADIGGKSVYVVAENGIPYHYEVIYPIVKHEVAAQGVTAVLLDHETEDFIQLYDINGTLRVDINTKTKTDGIPIDIALSEDGRKLVTLYVTFQGDSMMCKVTFYNAGEVGKNYIGNIVGQTTFEDNLLAYDLQFLDAETLCVLLENGFRIYRITEVPELICENILEESIIEMVCVEGGIYVVKEDAMKQRTMTFYNVKGNPKATWEKIPDYEKLCATQEEVIFTSPQSVTIYRNNQSLKFNSTFHENLEAVLSAGNDRYFLVDAGKIRTIKLSDGTKNEESKVN